MFCAQVLETRVTSDGALRAAVSLPGRAGEQHGWITLVARDGALKPTHPNSHPVALTPTTTGRNLDPHADHWPQAGPPPGAENAAYVSPQPAAEAPSEEQRARNKAREAEPVAQRETPGGAMFVFCCNGRGCVFCDRF